MGRRRDRIDKRKNSATVGYRKNSVIKEAERLRREKTMLTILKKGQFPYTPGVMSWLSDRLGIKASRITPADVKTLFQKA